MRAARYKKVRFKRPFIPKKQVEGEKPILTLRGAKKLKRYYDYWFRKRRYKDPQFYFYFNKLHFKLYLLPKNYNPFRIIFKYLKNFKKKLKKVVNSNFELVSFIKTKKKLNKYDVLNYKNSNFLRSKIYEKFILGNLKKKKYIKINKLRKLKNHKISLINKLLLNYNKVMPRKALKYVFYKKFPPLFKKLIKIIKDSQVLKIKKRICLYKLLKLNKSKKILSLRKKKLQITRDFKDRIRKLKKKAKKVITFKETVLHWEQYERKSNFRLDEKNVIENDIWGSLYKLKQNRLNWESYNDWYISIIQKINNKQFKGFKRFTYTSLSRWYYKKINKLKKLKKRFFYNILKNDFLTPLETNTPKTIKKKYFLVLKSCKLISNQTLIKLKLKLNKKKSYLSYFYINLLLKKKIIFIKSLKSNTLIKKYIKKIQLYKSILKKKFSNIFLTNNSFLIKKILKKSYFIKSNFNFKIIKSKSFVLFYKKFVSNYVELQFYIINIVITLNNTSMVITKNNGEIIYGITTGMLQFKGSKKNTFIATLDVAKAIVQEINERKLNNLKIVYKFSKRKTKLKHILRLFKKNFKINKIKILALINNTPLPYNGAKKKKKRR